MPDRVSVPALFIYTDFPEDLHAHKAQYYIIGLKLHKSAGEAIRQIDLKKYPERFALCGLPVVKVGVNADTERHTLTDREIRRT